VIDHVSIAVSDLARSRRFYQGLLAPLGLNEVVDRAPNTIGFGKKYPEFWLNARTGIAPQPETTGMHICLRAPSEEAVRDFHAAAIARGGRTAGDPGPRQAAFTTYFGAFIFDPDGNKIEAVYFGSKFGETAGFAGFPKTA
jgi:catechol 2,3-dioxygenase-like lactoylglutathione lyase family enzyme